MYYLGVDLGGTKILTALANEKGEILARSKIPTEANKGQEVVINNIIQTIDTVISESEVNKNEINKIGIGSPGPLNSKQGIIYESANIPLKNVHLVDIIEKEVGLPASLENDANAAALGEKWFGAGQNVDHMIYVTVSTGIGGGIIIDRELLQGVEGNGGEIGHMIIKPGGPRCSCGNEGCLEALASGTAIAQRGKESYHQDSSTLIAKKAGNDPKKIDALLVAQAAQEGDETAIEIYNQAGYYLGIGLANLINIFNTEKIVFGGGVMRDRELMEDALQKSIKENVLSTYLLEKVEIINSQLKGDIGVMGALAVAMEDRLK